MKKSISKSTGLNIVAMKLLDGSGPGETAPPALFRLSVMLCSIRIAQDPVRNVASQAFHDEAVVLCQHLIYQFGVDVLFGCPFVQGSRQLLFAFRPCAADDAQAELALQFSDKRQAIFWVKECPTSYKDKDQNE